MIDFGLEVQRQNFRRAHPDWDEVRIEAALLDWRARTRGRDLVALLETLREQR